MQRRIVPDCLRHFERNGRRIVDNDIADAGDVTHETDVDGLQNLPGNGASSDPRGGFARAGPFKYIA